MYNAMYFLNARPEQLNWRTTCILPKPGKPANRKESWRPISLQSIFGKPFDSIIAARYLSYSIRTKSIAPAHFGFIRGVSTKEAVLFLLDSIRTQLDRGQAAHLILYDFKGAFDTVEQEPFIETLHEDFGISGNALEYMRSSFKGRRGRVHINGYYSAWQDDGLGLMQGWPTAAIAFILFSTDLELINGLNLGLRIPCFADDTAVCSDGSVTEPLQLQDNLNWCSTIIDYISEKKHLILTYIKQLYMVISEGRSDDAHKLLYLDLKIGGVEIKKVYDKVRYLGLMIDRRLKWDVHINTLLRGARGSYLAIYHRFRASHEMQAIWVPMLIEAFVISKLTYLVDIWSCTTLAILAPMRTFYNKLIRFAQAASLSANLTFEAVQLGWPCFEDWIEAHQAALFTRVIRTPDTCALHDIIQEKWLRWLEIRLGDDQHVADERHPQKPEERTLEGVDCFRSELVNNGYVSEPDENKEFERRDAGDDGEFEVRKKKARKKVKMRDPIEVAFNRAKENMTTDYVFMNGVPFEAIIKRVSYHPRMLKVPTNSTFVLPLKKGDNPLGDDEEDTGFDVGWLRMWLQCHPEYEGIDENLVLVAMTDGSAKDMYGGCGFFACHLDAYDSLDMDDIHCAEYNPDELDAGLPANGLRDWIRCSSAVSRRSSIEYCELEAVVVMLRSLKGYFDALEEEDLLIPKVVSISIDSQVVLEWIAGHTYKYDIRVYRKLCDIYSGIRALRSWNVRLVWSWVHAHNEEVLNELADKLAKLAMLNMKQSASWLKNHSTIYGAAEWSNYGEKAAKKECRRMGINNTRRRWTRYCEETRKKFGSGAKAESDTCSRYLVKHNINASSAYKTDRKWMTRRDWETISAFRSGHVVLNAENKQRVGSKSCEHAECDGALEDIFHFMFVCPKYEVERKVCIDAVEHCYEKLDHGHAWQGLSRELQWMAIVFPVQNEIRSAIRDQNEDILERLLNHRKEVLFSFLKFVRRTKRLDYGSGKLLFFEF